MPSLFKTLTRSGAPSLSLQDWVSMFKFGGIPYTVPSQTIQNGREEIGADFRGYVEGAYKANGVVFACMLVRMLLFSEARFQWRQLRSGRPGDLFGSLELERLERPWPNATTGDLLSRAIQDVDLCGNFYARRTSRGIERMRPDWVSIVLGSNDPNAQAGDLGIQVAGYVYHPGGQYSGRDPVHLLRDEVAHFAPIPDPAASFRGMSWLTPVVREIMSDGAATDHKLKFFENGATPNMVVSLSSDVAPQAFQRFQEMFEAGHKGIENAYETLFLGGGADVTVVGADMKQIDFKVTQGHGETRIAAAAGVPPVIVGLSEGLEAATYSNYGQARRRFADGTMRPLWRNVAGSLATLLDVPIGAELWYDDRDIPFLQEDQKDAADIRKVDSDAIKALTEAGYEPNSVVDAVTSGDLKRLSHTGVFSVQLQPPGAKGSSNGNTPALPAPSSN